MRFNLVIDKSKEEVVTATVHERSELTDRIEWLVMQYSGADRLMVYDEEDIKLLPVDSIECITVLDGKTYAIDTKNKRYRLKQRLYELEAVLPGSFIRINKSTLANEKRLERFAAAFSGAVDAVFMCGHREYVSRRCFAQIKRRYEK